MGKRTTIEICAHVDLHSSRPPCQSHWRQWPYCMQQAGRPQRWTRSEFNLVLVIIQFRLVLFSFSFVLSFKKYLMLLLFPLNGPSEQVRTIRNTELNDKSEITFFLLLCLEMSAEICLFSTSQYKSQNTNINSHCYWLLYITQSGRPLQVRIPLDHLLILYWPRPITIIKLAPIWYSALVISLCSKFKVQM